MHRYNTLEGEVSDTSLLEKEFSEYVGSTYCAGFSSCGSTMYVALKSVGVEPGDLVLCNAFTLAPVPGAIENAGAKPVLVEITEDYVTDLDDLERKALETGAKTFLLSHMRGHIADMDRVVEICNRLGITLIEDCAHTMGASFGGRYTGTFGAVGCFSTQTYKHINSGEGGLLVTDDEDIIAKAILYSGSYMLYEKHLSRPPLDVFEKHKKHIPNFSLRMSNLIAALIRGQLPHLDDRCRRWNERYELIEAELKEAKGIRIPTRREKEGYVGSSFQFTIMNTDKEAVTAFINECANRGVELKWFGSLEPKGFTSRYESWQYIEEETFLSATGNVLDYLCDFRIPLTFTLKDCRVVAVIIKEVAEELF
nr:DegT/DnrJ/EryC1/StrS family aminotransferase [Pseudalkalibacillus hwajinpoensis]